MDLEVEYGVRYREDCGIQSTPSPWVSGCTSMGGGAILMAVNTTGSLWCLDESSGNVIWTSDAFAGVRGVFSIGDGMAAVCQPEQGCITIIARGGEVAAALKVRDAHPWWASLWEDQWLVVDAMARKLYLVDRHGVIIRPVSSQHPLKDPRSAIPLNSNTFLVCDRGRSVIAEVHRDGSWIRQFGRYANPGGNADQLASPEFAMPVPNGGLLICDTRNNRVLLVSSRGEINKLSGGSCCVGSGPGCLNAPVAACLASEGDVLVADAGNGRIVRLEHGRGDRTLWGSGVVDRFDFQFPRCFEPISQSYMVADSYHNRIAVISSAGDVIHSWYEACGREFFWPRFATCFGDQLYVCDSRNGRILVKPLSGGDFNEFKLYRNGRAIRLCDPHTIRATPHGMLIADTDGCRLVHVSSDGHILSAWGGETEDCVDEDIIDIQIELDVGDLHDGQMTEDGLIWLVDTVHHRILQIEQDGTVRRELSRLTVPNGTNWPEEFRWPRSLEILSDNNLLIADAGNNRVLIVQPDGLVKGLHGGNRGHAIGHLSDPRIATANGERVLITDYQNHRIVAISRERMQQVVRDGGRQNGESKC